MTAYFKDVNDLAEWVLEPCTRKSYVLPEQKDRAQKMLAEGGVLLSYIKGIRCWAGVSRIAGTNLRESAGDNAWERGFPLYFDIEPLYILTTQEKCFLARESSLQSGHDGRNIYRRILDPEVCKRICSRIERLYAMPDQEAKSEAAADGSFQFFQHDWDDTMKRSSFSSRQAIKLSGGKCSICDVTKQEWLERIRRGGKWPPGLPLDHADFELLQAHHLAPVKDGGRGQIDNLLAVCPNCHGLITRATRS